MKVDPGLAARLTGQEQRFGAPVQHPEAIICLRADGALVWDPEGRRYLDFLAPAHGHGNARIAAAMVEQCLTLCLAPPGCRDARLGPFLEKLCSLTGFETAQGAEGGAAAIQVALQAVRLWGARRRGIAPGQAEILVFEGSDHGPGLVLPGGGDPLAAAEAHGPLPRGFRVAPFGDPVAAREALGPATCAVLVEPVQGRNGPRLPPRGFLRELRALCDAGGVLLLADETRSGLGRTGRLFAFEHEGIRPDGAVLGPALGGGFLPAGAFLASRALMEQLAGQAPAAWGNPLACAVACAALEVLVEERLVDRAAELGAYFLARLRSMESHRVKNIRGLGLWAAIELRQATAPVLCAALARDGLICQALGEDVLHLAPPLMVSREQLDAALEKLEKVLGN